MIGLPFKQHLEMQADLLLQPKSKFLSGQQPKVKTRRVQAARVSNPYILPPSYNKIHRNLEALSWTANSKWRDLRHRYYCTSGAMWKHQRSNHIQPLKGLRSPTLFRKWEDKGMLLYQQKDISINFDLYHG